MAQRKKLGELLLSAGVIDEVQLRSAMGHQKNWGGKLGSALVELGITSEEVIARVLEEQLKQHCLGEDELKPQPEALKMISMQDALRYVVLPLKVDARELVLAMSNPFDLAIADEIGFRIGKKVRGMLAMESAIKKSIKKYYGTGTGRDYKIELKETSGNAEIIHYDSAPAQKPPQPKKVEPSTDIIAKAVAYLLIEKGIIKREELIEKMRLIKEKG